MKRSRSWLAGVIALLLAGRAITAEDLSGAKSLYASASYEEALTMLASLEASEDFEQVHQLRALCLLALGRTREAEETIERLVLHTPTYAMRDTEVSPKLVSVFQDVRRRTLPTAIRSLYTKAKASYDAKRWVEAKGEFEGLLALLGDPDLAAQKNTLTDLQQLGEGFLKLADNELTAEAKARQDAEAAEQRKRAEAEAAQRASAAQAAAAAAARTPAAAASPAPPTSDRPRSTEAPGTPALAAGNSPAAAQTGPIYTTSNRDVTPPVEQRRTFPRWSPPNRLMAMSTQTGLLEVVVDEKGAVTSATMAKPITPSYDAALTSAARDWRFTPAQKGGQPVRYRLLLEIVLRPTQ